MLYSAVSITGADSELVLAVADDYSPTAAEDRGNSLTVFFRDPQARDDARQAIAAAFPDAVIAAREVDDEDWARRSQENLQPITIGRLTVYPSGRDLRLLRPSPESPGLSPAIVIQPSMGFGTGHHATTRLCLLALQREALAGRSVLDIGTGSGILAIASVLLGASRAVGIDNDPDAIHAARENLSLNSQVTRVAFQVSELGELHLNPSTTDIAVANLTGALLAREGRRILAAVRPGGRIIVSGLVAAERGDVLAAFQPAVLAWEQQEDEWVALAFTAPPNDLP